MKYLLALLMFIGLCYAAVTSLVEVASDSPDTAASTIVSRELETTVPSRDIDLEDLPTITQTSDVDNVKLAQALVNMFGGALTVDGSWGPKTAAGVAALRNTLAISEGDSIDSELWAAAFERVKQQADKGQNGEGKIRSLQSVTLPDVLLLTEVDELEGGWIAWSYVAPKTFPIEELVDRVDALNPVKTLGGWKFCETEGKTSVAHLRRFWWAYPERMLSVVVKTVAGVTQVVVTEEQSVPLDGCEGYKTTATTEAVAGADPGFSNGGGSSEYGGGGSCFVGMNLEDCEDLLGLTAGERIRYVDCTGEQRDVWWASNWWIVDIISETAVISKSAYGCA